MTLPPKGRLLMLHKPKGYVVTRSDEKGRRTVYDLLPEWAREEGWMPVGRLDLDSKGLLLFTRDGKLSDRLTRPGTRLKTYEVWVRGHVLKEHVEMMRRGIRDKGETLKAVEVRLKGGAGPKTRLEVVLDEGKNRHIRRMLGALKDPKFGTPLKVLELKRTAVGNLRLDLESGKWRPLAPSEESALLSGKPPVP